MSVYLNAEFPHISLGGVCAPSAPDPAIEQRRQATNAAFETLAPADVGATESAFQLGFEEARCRALLIMEAEGLSADWSGSRAIQAVRRMGAP